DSLPPPDRAADGIGVVDLKTLTLLRTLKSGQDPETFDTSVDGTTLFAANEDAAQMTALDIASGEIKGVVAVGEEPEGVTVRPDGGVVYVTCEETNDVAVVDIPTLKLVTRFKTGNRPRAVAFTADSSTAFISDETSGTVSVVDAQKHTLLTTIKIPPPSSGQTAPPLPMGLDMSADGSRLYVGLGRAQAVAEIDVAKREVLRVIENVGTRPWGVAVTPDGQTLYTANGPGGDVSV